jgi:hypothetical protein
MSEQVEEGLSPETAAAVVEAAKATRTASFSDLKKKPRRTLSFHVTVASDDGTEQQLQMVFRACSSTRFDELQGDHPPTDKERRAGAIYNVATFAPALIAEVSHEPRLSIEQARELYTSDDWSSGEVQHLFLNALGVCQRGLDVPFNARD